MTAEEFQHIATSIPKQPGVYKYFSEQDEILYIGKAKNLRKRVSSYFTKKFPNYKTHELVRRIRRVEFTVVNSEQDAFFLENTLIKKFQPRYNINLKDDKSYPYIVTKNEPFPRVFLTRKLMNDGSEYLGPYTSVQKVRDLLAFIRQLIPLRTCTLNLTSGNIEKKKFRVCLEYHLGNCKGPCAGLQDRADYNNSLGMVKDLLKGNLGPVLNHFKRLMKEEADNLEFEKAEQARKKVEFLHNYQSRSVVVNPKLGNVDVFSFRYEEDRVFINYLMVQYGIVVQSKNFTISDPFEETSEEVLIQAISQARELFNSDAEELVLPVSVSYPDTRLKVSLPRAGDKKKLLDLSLKNLHYYIEEFKEKKRLKLSAGKQEQAAVLNQMKQDLKLPVVPDYIECFDNSNFQGAYPVSAMVCFKQGQPSKKDYRLFNIKSVKGIDDFASMKEAVYRRYKRVLDEKTGWPDLVIIDGGKGQLHAAYEALDQLSATDKTTLVGLAKKEEELYFPGDRDSIRLPLNSESLKLIRRIRDEVHRFGISFHRKKRSAGTFQNELENIPGIGRATAERLLKEFRSIKNIRKKDKTELDKIIGKSKARALMEYFKKTDLLNKT